MLDVVFAPSRAAARDLVARGLDPRRVRVLPAAWTSDAILGSLGGPSPAPAGASRRAVRNACPGGPAPGVPARRG